MGRSLRQLSATEKQRALLSEKGKSILNVFHVSPEAVARRCSVKEVFLKMSQNSQENTCVRVSSLIKLQPKTWNVTKKETLAQVFSFEFCEIFWNTYFYRTPLVTASVCLANDKNKSFSYRYWASSLRSSLIFPFYTQISAV